MPVVRPLGPAACPERLFAALAGLPSLIWFDSASAKPLRQTVSTKQTSAESSADDLEADDLEIDAQHLARYSFYSADPVDRLVVYPGDPCPWDKLERWVNALPETVDASMPPFQGGVAGLIGYEASRWLEPHELAGCFAHQCDDLANPAMAVGLYDWTLAVDHRRDQMWLISQGFDQMDFAASGDGSSTAQRVQRANRRADQIERRLDPRTVSLGQWRMDRPPTRSAISPASESNQVAVESNFHGSGFRDAVAEIVERIHRGDCFQVNLAQRLTARTALDPKEVYLRLRAANPAPFAAYFDAGDFQFLSSSPEGFLEVRDRKVVTRPIKGTIARSGDAQIDQRLAKTLQGSDKERAENLMIVDLMRNDFSRFCVDESVTVEALCEIERYQCVQHLVSTVSGRLRDDATAASALRACFPGGSVTGAPKIEAMRTIAELEPHPRGAYCGSLGYISCGGDADFNILIRTMTHHDGTILVPVGGGITARSKPVAEEAETWTKAEGMLRAISACVAAAPRRTPAVDAAERKL